MASVSTWVCTAYDRDRPADIISVGPAAKRDLDDVSPLHLLSVLHVWLDSLRAVCAFESIRPLSIRYWTIVYTFASTAWSAWCAAAQLSLQFPSFEWDRNANSNYYWSIPELKLNTWIKITASFLISTRSYEYKYIRWNLSSAGKSKGLGCLNWRNILRVMCRSCGVGELFSAI
jgi:hypothetical protein